MFAQVTTVTHKSDFHHISNGLQNFRTKHHPEAGLNHISHYVSNINF